MVRLRCRDFVILVVACGLPMSCGGAAAASPPPESPPAETATAKPEDRALSPAEIAERATPSVVAIKTARSIGSGFVVRKDGWIATNLHVLLAGPDVAVFMADGTRFEVAEVLAVDQKRDLALLRIDANDLPQLALADAAALRAGAAVVAIGHPLGFEDTVSDGLISAVREVDETLTLLQISAPIAPGSSGGPLLDDRGRVVGVATAIHRRGQNLNFGVPTQYLQALMDSPANPMSWQEFAKTIGERDLPTIERHVPNHAVRMLKGCGEGDLRLLVHMIDEAVQVGAPLYNDGKFAACYHVYEGAASDAERRLGSGCSGPKRALASGRKKAAKLANPAEQAWAMRDAFDGLLDVIRRKLAPAASNAE